MGFSKEFIAITRLISQYSKNKIQGVEIVHLRFCLKLLSLDHESGEYLDSLLVFITDFQHCGGYFFNATVRYMDKIGIIGAGELGQSMAKILRTNGVKDIEQWDIDPTKVPDQRSREEVVQGSEVLLLCIPSWVMRNTLQEMSSLIPSSTIAISLAKGLEEGTRNTMADVLEQTLGENKRWALLSGPMLAEEMEVGLPAAGVLAAKDISIFDTVKPYFAGSNLSLVYSDDVKGTAMAGVLKNVYAIGMGMLEGLELGSNARGWYIYLASQEMGKILEMLGNKKETAYSVAGLADLVATGLSPYSRNHQVGRELITTGICSISEGCKSLPSLTGILEEQLQELPVMFTLDRIVAGHEPAEKAFRQLLRL